MSEGIQRYQSTRFLLDLAVLSIVGSRRMTRKQAFMTGASWATMIRVQAYAVHGTRLVYSHNGHLVDAWGNPAKIEGGDPVRIVPFTQINIGLDAIH